ncbi:hypothetical protein CYMTET_50598 [Cymbomonas tetramitiformis]|uniref:Polymerase nucleotidyl transferase domain-containing protein n=1 Tax=Cymbomonas tetramitiformis TaxID=36881 RepID=A0AAE0BNV2_9CHLO|nr:hypothetical protein CYMTET_50598 [Cymbomonas tetramitiformis]
MGKRNGESRKRKPKAETEGGRLLNLTPRARKGRAVLRTDRLLAMIEEQQTTATKRSLHSHQYAAHSLSPGIANVQQADVNHAVIDHPVVDHAVVDHPVVDHPVVDPIDLCDDDVDWGPLHREVESFAKAAKSSPQQTMIAESVVTCIRSIGRDLWPSSSTHIIGSRAIGLALLSADIDMTILGVPGIVNEEGGGGFSDGVKQQVVKCLRRFQKDAGDGHMRDVWTVAVPVVPF